jgi:hypothetical protein
MFKKIEWREAAMEQTGSNYTPAYQVDELRYDRFRKSFAGESHDFYVVYDEIVDQLIIRLVPAAVFVSEYYVTGDTAFLVQDDTKEVVGYSIIDFQTTFLPKNAPRLSDLWIEQNIAKKWSTYTKLSYDARQPKQNPGMTEYRILNYAVYESKARGEAELVMA